MFSRPTWPSRSSSSALALGALAQQGLPGRQHGSHQQRPGQHPAPGQFAPADLAQRKHVKRLALGGQVLVEFKAPAAVAKMAGLQHENLPFMLQRHAHRAGVRHHGPFAPRHHGTQVKLQCVACGLGRQHQLVAAAGKIRLRQHRPAQGPRQGRRIAQAFIGPDGIAVLPVHANDLRVDRRQALLGLGCVGSGLQQRQRGHDGVVLHHALAQQPVRNAGVGFKIVAQLGQLEARQRHAAECRDGAPEHGPDQPTLSQLQHRRILA